MKYRLKIAQETADVDAFSSGSEQNIEFIIGEETYCLHLVVDGKAIEAFHIRGGHGKHVFVNGRSFLVEDADQLPLRRGRRTGIDQAPGDVTPPMPSVVVRIMVEEGDLVKKGQGLIVVTAMKMETTLKAPYNGRVTAIKTTVDAKVAPGDILVEIEEEEPENE
ncbi:MAG: acetyl-CoA carboxylase biotin carboxyl carrier protein subunit [Deltaproteobacteria bacterium]|nr:acetyl-CoA carboxylase biotin carboxyl carrier protein subunit [Deltaproteobacteria bacterium]